MLDKKDATVDELRSRLNRVIISDEGANVSCDQVFEFSSPRLDSCDQVFEFESSSSRGLNEKFQSFEKETNKKLSYHSKTAHVIFTGHRMVKNNVILQKKITQNGLSYK